MQVAITGSSGLLGTALSGALTGAGHTVVPVVRHPDPGPGALSWDPAAGAIDATGFTGIDAVIHLAGAGIGDRRWTPERKELIRDSRIGPTGLLARALSNLENGPRVLVSASAIGIYGDRGDEVLTESSPIGDDWLAGVCADWEAAATPASDAGIRTVFLRTGLVQSRDGGALGRSLLPFKLGLGGRFGSGAQWWSWVSIDDVTGAVLHLLGSDVSGPVNVTGPEPVTNAVYTKALGRALRRPTLFPIPKIGPNLLFGREMVDSLLYVSQRVLPERLRESGYHFRHATLEQCLSVVLGDEELAG